MTLNGGIEIIEAMKHGGYGIIIDGAIITCGVPAEMLGTVEKFKLSGETVFANFAVVGIEHGLNFGRDLLGFAFGEAGVGVGAGEQHQDGDAEEEYNVGMSRSHGRIRWGEYMAIWRNGFWMGKGWVEKG